MKLIKSIPLNRWFNRAVLILFGLFVASDIAMAQNSSAGKDSAEYYVNLGKEFLQKNTEEDRLQAIDLFYKAIEVDLDYGPAYTELSNAFRLQAPWDGKNRYQVDMAISFGEKAVFLDPDNQLAHLALGRAYLSKRWYRQAKIHFLRADELNATAETADRLGWIELELGNTDKALKHYKRGLSFDTTNTTFKYYIAINYRVLGLSDDADIGLKKVLQEYPNSLNVHSHIVLLHIQQQNMDDAIQAAKTALERNPEEVRFKSLAAYAYLFDGDINKVIEHLEAVVNQSGEDPFIGWWGTYSSTVLGYAYLTVGRKAEAQKLLQQSKEGYYNRMIEGGEGWGYMYDLARVYAVLGDTEKTLKWLETALNFGFGEYYLARLDPLMGNLHDSPEYKQLMSRLENKVAAMRENVIHNSNLD